MHLGVLLLVNNLICISFVVGGNFFLWYILIMLFILVKTKTKCIRKLLIETSYYLGVYEQFLYENQM